MNAFKRSETQPSPDKKARGAKASETSWADNFHAWRRHHQSSCRDSLRRLLSSPFQSLLTWLVIAIALALPTALYLGLKNVQVLGDGWQDNSQMSAFLVEGAKPQAIDTLRRQLLSNEQIQNIDVLDPQGALAEFQAYSGLGDVLSELDDNPLPTVFVIQPAVAVDTPDKLELLKVQIENSSIIDNVQLDLGWLQRLHELLNIGQRIVFSLAGLLLLGVLLIIGNTLRLAIEGRRDEIIVIKMVGATDGFVRRPFLYTGLWYGLGGGLIALLLLASASFSLSAPLERLVLLYGSQHAFSGLGLSGGVILIALAGLLGWLGAWLAVSRHLRQIEPS